MKGPKAGQSEIFADGLPGMPDNIRRCRSGGYWVPLALCHDSDGLFIRETIAAYPEIRRQMAKVQDVSSPLIIPLGNVAF